MTTPSSPQQPNALGNASLVLSILSMALVFGIGLCALTGVTQNWIQLVGTPLSRLAGIVRLWGQQRLPGIVPACRDC